MTFKETTMIGKLCVLWIFNHQFTCQLSEKLVLCRLTDWWLAIIYAVLINPFVKMLTKLKPFMTSLSFCDYLRMYSYQSRVPPPPPPLSRAVIPSKRPRVSLSGGGNRRTKTSFSSSSKSSQRTSRTSRFYTELLKLWTDVDFHT